MYTERNCSSGNINVLLLYPDSHAAALGSPGFRQVYRTLSGTSGIIVDWAWFDDKNNRIVYESQDCKGKYDCVAFSVPFELLYTNVVRCLTELDIEPEREKRKEKEPLVIVGGAAPTINPAIGGQIADVVYIGEAENYIIETIRQSMTVRKTGAARQLTPMLGSNIPKVNVAAPRFILPLEQIESSCLSGFDNPNISAFKDAGLVEVGRGCSRGCRFCAAGYIYLPVRHRSVEIILRDVDTYQGRAERIGLVGASISDHRYLKEILRGILDRGFGLTTSSFRADMLDSELASLLKKGGLKTITIAPEGGSERIRKIINKQLDEEEILDAVRACAYAGIKNLRLYFMVGLPWEKETDTDAIPVLTEKIREEFRSPDSKITISVNPFIPKPQTPFQWCGMAELSYIKKIYKKLERAFRVISGITLKTLSVRVAEREAVISLGDERVGMAVIENARDGIPWKKALSRNKVNIQELVHRMKESHEVFPWDNVTGEKTKTALLASFVTAQCTAEKP